MTAARLVATWFGVGRIPVAPGTAGTLAALPIPVLLAWLEAPRFVIAVVAAVSVPLAVAVAGRAAREMGAKDPPEIVIDEVSGVLVACSLVPASPIPMIAAVALFRVLDAWKPGPLRRLEDLPGGWGIVLDDAAAGLVAGLAVLAWLQVAGRVS